MITMFETIANHTKPITLKLIASDFTGKYYDDSINGVLPTAARRIYGDKYILSNGIDLSVDNDHYMHDYYSNAMFFQDSQLAMLYGYDNTVIRTLVLIKSAI